MGKNTDKKTIVQLIRKSRVSFGEKLLALHLHDLAPLHQYRFAPPRRWKFDFAFPDHKLAIEVEGAIWTNGRHTRGSGYIKDMEKYNQASVIGWTLLRFSTAQVRSGEANLKIRDVLEKKSL